MSSAVDMAKWMRFNLNNGTTQDGESLVGNDPFHEIFRVFFQLMLLLTAACFVSLHPD